jgi:hypothetical protein
MTGGVNDSFFYKKNKINSTQKKIIINDRARVHVRAQKHGWGTSTRLLIVEIVKSNLKITSKDKL